MLQLFVQGVDGAAAVEFAGTENSRREVCEVGRGRQVLRLEADGMTDVVHRAGFASVLLYVVAGIDDKRLHVGVEVEGEIRNRKRGVGFGCESFVQQPSTIYTAPGRKEGQVVPLAKQGGAAEVHRCAGYGAQFANRAGVPVRGRIGIGVYRERVCANIARALAREIKIGVLGEVDDGRRIGDGFVVDNQRAESFGCFRSVLQHGCTNGIGDKDMQVAGVTFFAIGREEVQADGVAREGYDVPGAGVETVDAAVEGVGTIIGREVVGVSVKGEMGIADATGIAADDGVEVRFLIEPFFVGIEPEDDVTQFAGTSRRDEGEDFSSVVGDSGGDETVGNGERIHTIYD